MRSSCIGIGSNAIRLLEADCDNLQLTPVLRERRGTRLFAGLVNGRLTEESMSVSVEAVRELAQIARSDNYLPLYIFATSAVRDAENGQEFSDRCLAATGVPVELVSGEDEGVLAYIGCSTGAVEGVIDIGGGSTEFALGHGTTVDASISLQIGAVRLNGQHPIFSSSDYDQTVDSCMEIISSRSGSLLCLPPRTCWTGVGGTMTTLGAMKKQIPLFDSLTCEGMLISQEEVARTGRDLSAMTMEMRRHVPGLMPHRADIIPSGIAILEASMRVFSIPEIRLSARGNMDGYLKKKIFKFS